VTTDSRQSFAGRVHFENELLAIGSRAMTLFVKGAGRDEWQKLATLPLYSLKSLAARNRSAARLLRGSVDHVLFHGGTPVILACGHVFRCDLDARRAQLVGRLSGSRPLAVASTREGRLYYGEYRNNVAREPIRVWRSEDGGSAWSVAWTFNRVRHVHGVFEDPYSDTMWVTTGDTDEECGIWRTDDQFKSLHRVAGGSQQTRAINLLFTPSEIYFGTDTPTELNFIYRMDRNRGVPERLLGVEGSVFHACQAGKYLVFSSACEPSTVNTERTATVWASADGTRWRRVARFHKDLLPMRWFQYGQVYLAGGRGSDSSTVWVTPFATNESSTSYRIDLREN
jgi:hypothetical protein